MNEVKERSLKVDVGNKLREKKKIKGIVEKVVLILSLWIMFFSFLIKPLYSEYIINQEMVSLKSTLAQKYKDEITEDHYREEIERLSGKLEETKDKIPDRFSEVELYETLVNFTTELGLELISVKFTRPKILEDVVLKSELEKNNNEDNEEDQLIISPNQEVLAHQFIEVKIRGSLEQEGKFLENIEELSLFLIINTISGLDEAENSNGMVISMETYGLLDKELIKNEK